MATTAKQDLLRRLPSVSRLLESAMVAPWLAAHPQPLVAECLRQAVDALRHDILDDTGGRCGPAHVSDSAVLDRAGALLAERTAPKVRGAINATGILLHTALGRAVWPECVVDAMIDDLKGYVTLAIDRQTGHRSERDHRIEPLLTELTGAQAATLASNNAGATLLVLAALCAGREVIVSRGQLIEIGGAFRLPDVMAQSGCRMVEVGTTNRTHLRDYERAITPDTAAILRVHPSNFRVVGFTAEVETRELAALAHERGVLMIDDLGAGALVSLERFGLPHEPTVPESIAAGADVALFSADKLIGAGQGGVIVGTTDCIERIRKHPLARALRVDKACLMVLERTLMLFRDPDRLPQRHPLYRMLATPLDVLRARAEALAASIARAVPAAQTEVVASQAYLGSGSMPAQTIPSWAVVLTVPGVKAAELARRLRIDDACVFARIESETLVLDARTLTDAQVALVAAAVGRVST